MVIKRSAVLLFVIFCFAVSVQAADELPLASPGAYGVGLKTMRFQDQQRDRIVLNTSIWYPALADTNGNLTVPDRSGAPYPLVIYSHGWGGTPAEAEENGLAAALVSHGFVVAAMRHNSDNSYNGYIDRPLDTLFILNSLAALEEGELVGMIDTDRVGVTGWSWGAYTAVAASGARLNPSAIQSLVADPEIAANYPGWEWDSFLEYGSRRLTLAEGNLWPAITDDRILAVLPIAGSDAPLFGEEGLAAITKPLLMVAGTADQFAPYSLHVLPVFEETGTADRTLLSLVDVDHFFPLQPNNQRVLAHFAVAWFGYYLQDKAEYARYFSAEYVSSLSDLDNLVWGVYAEDA